MVSRVSPDWLKLYTFVVLLPLILLQAAGIRRPIQAERSAGLIFGVGVGVLYSVTTISGPPLAIALNNQGFAKKEFRAALGFVRLAESSMTAIAYVYAGLFVQPSFALLPWIVPSVAIGVPIGAFIIRRMRAETFRRICMSFDAWVVALRPVEAAARPEVDRRQRRLSGARRRDRDRRLAAVSLLLGRTATVDAAVRPPAFTRRRSVAEQTSTVPLSMSVTLNLAVRTADQNGQLDRRRPITCARSRPRASTSCARWSPSSSGR